MNYIDLMDEGEMNDVLAIEFELTSSRTTMTSSHSHSTLTMLALTKPFRSSAWRSVAPKPCTNANIVSGGG